MKARTATRSRSFRLVIGAILAAFVAVLTLLPGVASAATVGPTQFVTVPVTHLSDRSWLIQLPANFRAGDCTQFAGSNIRISYPDSNDNSLVTWNAIAQTSHTNNADIWHQAVFATMFGGQSFQVPLMDGDPMRKTFTTYTWQRTTVAHVPSLGFTLQQAVTLQGIC